MRIRFKIANRLKSTRHFVVLGTIIALTFLFPFKHRFFPSYRLGSVWSHPDLIAESRFPILKDSESRVEDENELAMHRIPVYVKLKRYEEQSKKSFLKIASENALSAKNITSGIRFMDSLFSVGIILPDANHFNNRDKSENEIYIKSDEIKSSTFRDVIWPDEISTNGSKEQVLALKVLEPNLRYSDSITVSRVNATHGQALSVFGIVKEGQYIVRKGELISKQKFLMIKSYQKFLNDQYFSTSRLILNYLGYLILSMLIIGILATYIFFYDRKIFENLNELSFVLGGVMFMAIVTYFVKKQTSLDLMVIPFCIVPIVVKNFFNDRLALFSHICTVLICSLIAESSFDFLVIQLLVGGVAVITSIDFEHWFDFFESVLYIVPTYFAASFGIALISGNFYSFIDSGQLVWILLNGLLTLLAFPLIPLLEKSFKFTSSVTLNELNDLNHPLLKKLSYKAPGTFQHSIQVSNLSESAALKIGANGLLVKVGSLYHDIGKTKNPSFFVENQSGFNPHQDLTFFESAKIILEHVTEGVRLAKRYKIPEPVIDFIRTHHGTTRVEYFFQRFIAVNPEKMNEESLFRYPGPRPRTKEETIMMISDSLEASSRSLDHPTESDINQLVDRIIAMKIADGQLIHSELSFEELEICTKSFKQVLKSIHHDRISYQIPTT
jgi:cyclic-di-AMP phosphodiesterase PgpH